VIGYLTSKERLIFFVFERRVLRIRPNREMKKIMLKLTAEFTLLS
jgi:hypothetical protein